MAMIQDTSLCTNEYLVVKFQNPDYIVDPFLPEINRKHVRPNLKLACPKCYLMQGRQIVKVFMAPSRYHISLAMFIGLSAYFLPLPSMPITIGIMY